MALCQLTITERRMVCDDKWHSVVRVPFFILDEIFSVNTTCFAKTTIYARIVVTPLFQMTFQLFPKPFFLWFVRWSIIFKKWNPSTPFLRGPFFFDGRYVIIH
jgi:hypothetical protein